MKSKPILIVDSRERNPLDFDGDDDFLEIKHEKLDSGDYSISGLEHIISIERKKNIDELFVNFTQNKHRIFAEFERIKDHKIKVIVVEQDCAAMLNPMEYYINKHKINKQHPTMPSVVVLNGIMSLMVEHNVHIFFAGSKAKTIIKKILLTAYKLHQQDKL